MYSTSRRHPIARRRYSVLSSPCRAESSALSVAVNPDKVESGLIFDLPAKVNSPFASTLTLAFTFAFSGDLNNLNLPLPSDNGTPVLWLILKKLDLESLHCLWHSRAVDAKSSNLDVLRAFFIRVDVDFHDGINNWFFHFKANDVAVFRFFHVAIAEKSLVAQLSPFFRFEDA